MLSATEHAPDFHATRLAYREAVQHCINAMAPLGQTVELPVCDDAYQAGLNEDHVYVIVSGTLSVQHAGRALWQWEAGDLIGLDHFADGQQRSPLERLMASDLVELRSFPIARLDDLLNSSPALRRQWLRLVALQQALLSKLIGRLAPDASAVSRGFRRFEAGQIMVRQGDEADYVYTILQGGATVEVDGVEVGTVREQEIFGALAVLTGTTRSASVIARSPCSVMMVPREEFYSLLTRQPQLFLSMVQDMAQTIVALNSRVLERTAL